MPLNTLSSLRQNLSGVRYIHPFDQRSIFYFAHMFEKMNWALVVPMANEENDFAPFIRELFKALEEIKSGKVYLVVDKVSKDRTLELCQKLSKQDPRFTAVWAPENKNVVDAYLRGYREALKSNHDFILEMDAGLSHDPKALTDFLEAFQRGYECVFGSRFMEGGSMGDSPFKRKLLSKGGTMLSNVLLGSKLKDMTSGYQGFTKEVVKKFTDYQLKSTAHFYQTEIRYLLRNRKQIEIPISYNAPSPRVSESAIKNSFQVLFYYFWKRITFRPLAL
jgi:dolichol-phosphate mannosyltransferase